MWETNNLVPEGYSESNQQYCLLWGWGSVTALVQTNPEDQLASNSGIGKVLHSLIDFCVLAKWLLQKQSPLTTKTTQRQLFICKFALCIDQRLWVMSKKSNTRLDLFILKVAKQTIAGQYCLFYIKILFEIWDVVAKLNV